jgi:hypothetical protein
VRAGSASVKHAEHTNADARVRMCTADRLQFAVKQTKTKKHKRRGSNVRLGTLTTTVPNVRRVFARRYAEMVCVVVVVTQRNRVVKVLSRVAGCVSQRRMREKKPPHTTTSATGVSPVDHL